MKYVYKKRSYKFIFSFIDMVGNMVFFPLRLFSSRTVRSAGRILMIRCDHIGDVLSATVILEPLRKAFPGAVIDFMAPSWAAEVLENNPYINNVIKFDPPWFDRRSRGFLRSFKGLKDMIRLVKRGKYDVVVDLRGDARHIMAAFLAGVKYRLGYGITGGAFMLTHRVPYKGVMHETERNMALLRPLGIDVPPPGVKLYFSDEDGKKADHLMQESEIEGKYAVFHTVPGHYTKKWYAANFVRVMRYIHDTKGLTPVIVGSEGDKGVIKKIMDVADTKVIDISGKTSLPVLAQVMSRASLFVGVDSAPAHIAAAVGTPTIILFSGVNDPSQWAPKGGNVKVVYPGEGERLSMVEPDEVCRIIDKLLQVG
ncbi:MAG: glycosyltransferase family 9 protein, partial [Candidatus Omnitrophota bacterium]